MSEPRYDPEEPIGLDEDPEDVLRKLLSDDGEEDEETEQTEDEPS